MYNVAAKKEYHRPNSQKRKGENEKKKGGEEPGDLPEEGAIPIRRNLECESKRTASICKTKKQTDEDVKPERLLFSDMHLSQSVPWIFSVSQKLPPT